ncbi:MAG: AbrB/MazE/SpoVT family DNA-binding domain-containing protein [Syntrophobacteraceae bacterium]|nr:AbrB/MazE/SpoVT family DNA-binding domain-containing protein [Syntrophobacteraceae bacterium]
MKQTLLVSNRGQLTLPVSVRKRLGIKNGGAIIMEVRDNELILKPAIVLEVEMYTEEQVLAWDETDHLDEDERQTVLRRLEARQ